MLGKTLPVVVVEDGKKFFVVDDALVANFFSVYKAMLNLLGAFIPSVDPDTGEATREPTIPNPSVKPVAQVIPVVQGWLDTVNKLFADAQQVAATTPFYKKWWFWAAVGVVVVGGGYALTRKKPQQEQLTA